MAPVCANCHEAQWNSIDLSPHGAKSDADGSMCQACHGNAAEHLKDPMKAKPAQSVRPRATPPTQRTAVCLTCHSGNRNLAFWTSGKHQLNDVTCSNCHSIHGKVAGADDQQVRDDVPARTRPRSAPTATSRSAPRR